MSILKLQIAICDDEPILCEELKKIILDLFPEYRIDIFYSGRELLELPKVYDIIFLDIEMPEEDGMEIAKNLRMQNYKSYIIFLTSHTEYMPEAFKVKAFRFLQKPINIDNLNEALADAQKELANRKKIVFDNFGIEMLVDVQDILYIRADGKSTVLHLENQQIETGKSLKYWTQKFEDYDFCQIHKSYVVSMGHVRQVLPEGVMLKETGEIIPLSRRRYSMVKDAFYQYIEEHSAIM